MPNFSGPEADFCIQVLASELRNEPIRLRAPDNINWNIVAAFLEQNRLAPHFYMLGQQNPGLFPSELRERLRPIRYATLLYGDKCFVEVRDVLTSLRQAEIPVIVLKGWAVIYTLYGGDYGQRSYSDVDILISQDQINRAETLLTDLGFSQIADVHPGYSHQFNNARIFFLPGAPMGSFGLFSIGLHWGLTHYPYYDEKKINIPMLFERTLPLCVAGVDVLELGFEDQLIYSCAHLALHHRNEETLLTYFEIAALIQRAKAKLDWTVVTTRAKEWHYLVQVQVVLAQVQQLWPGVISPENYKKILECQASLSDRLIDQLVANTKGNDFRSSLIELIAIPGIKNKFIATFHQLFPDKEYMQSRYGVDEKQGLLGLYATRIKLAAQGLAKKNGN